MNNYQVNVRNNSHASFKLCCYRQRHDSAPGVYPLAWIARSFLSHTQVVLYWQESYGFIWAETGTAQLQPGQLLLPAQNVPANPETANYITLQNNGYSFFSPVSNETPGVLTIDVAANIRPGTFAVGYSIGDNPAFAAGAMPGVRNTFIPSSDIYLTVGDYLQGEVLDASVITNNVRLSFPAGSSSLDVTLNEDFTWSVR